MAADSCACVVTRQLLAGCSLLIVDGSPDQVWRWLRSVDWSDPGSSGPCLCSAGPAARPVGLVGGCLELFVGGEVVGVDPVAGVGDPEGVAVGGRNAPGVDSAGGVGVDGDVDGGVGDDRVHRFR
jgi:hypothetical protein